MPVVFLKLQKFDTHCFRYYSSNKTDLELFYKLLQNKGLYGDKLLFMIYNERDFIPGGGFIPGKSHTRIVWHKNGTLDICFDKYYKELDSFLAKLAGDNGLNLRGSISTMKNLAKAKPKYRISSFSLRYIMDIEKTHRAIVKVHTLGIFESILVDSNIPNAAILFGRMINFRDIAGDFLCWK